MLQTRLDAQRAARGRAMTAIPAVRVLQIGGLVLFAIGALLLAIGTTSIVLFIVYAVLTFGGAILFLTGKKLQQRSVR
jgi:hypothetical protein